MEIKIGRVKWFNSEKGFGFIVCEGKEYFLHFSELKIDGFKTIDKDCPVKFNATVTNRGLKAECVTVYETDKQPD